MSEDIIEKILGKLEQIPQLRDRSFTFGAREILYRDDEVRIEIVFKGKTGKKVEWTDLAPENWKWSMKIFFAGNIEPFRIECHHAHDNKPHVNFAYMLGLQRVKKGFEITPYNYNPFWSTATSYMAGYPNRETIREFLLIHYQGRYVR